jgi:2,4-dienoyl-CoA reductase-like NADH-dependent reductase (Old Yellow Enzyme family)
MTSSPIVVALGQSIAGQSEFAYEDLRRMVSALHLHTEHTVAVWMQLCHPGRAESTLYRY